MILFCTASLCRSVALSNNNSCIENLLSMKHELKTFADLVQNGKNIIFLNFFFDNSTYDLIPHEEMSKQWIWITEAYQYILSYSQDGDVFSFGLLNAEKAFLTVKISIANLTEGCKFNVDQYFLHHFSHVREGSNTTTNTILETPKWHLCFATLKRNKFEDFISDISGVKIRFPFWCYTKNNGSKFIGKSYVIYIVICVILYAFILPDLHGNGILPGRQES